MLRKMGELKENWSSIEGRGPKEMAEGLAREMFLKDTEANLTYWPLFYQNSKIRGKASSVSFHDRAQGLKP